VDVLDQHVGRGQQGCARARLQDRAVVADPDANPRVGAGGGGDAIADGADERLFAAHAETR
jgi:hypothetical protein